MTRKANPVAENEEEEEKTSSRTNGDHTKSELKRLQKQFEEALIRQYNAESTIGRSGDRIIVPSWMSLPDAAKAITAYDKQREEMTSTVMKIECHPNDGLVCFRNAMQNKFGQFLATESMHFSFFGAFVEPAQMISVKTNFNESTPCPVGKVEVPGLKIEFNVSTRENKDAPTKGALVVEATYKRMYQPLVNEIEQATRDELRTNSIFRGKAIDSRYEFLDLNIDTTRFVLSAHERRAVVANIYTVIEKTARAKRMKAPIKRTILLSGKYGVGKTLCGLESAKRCVASGWTFMNVRPGDPIVPALNFAKEFQPCMVFMEDVDISTGTDRDEALNTILNEIDGVLTKNSQVMVILTTNRVKSISKAMMRPGRIDAWIEMGILDADTVLQLVRAYGDEHIVEPLDRDKIWDAAHDYVPAFIVEAVNKAKLYALADADDNVKNLQITSQNVEDALIELRPQFELMNEKQELPPSRLDTIFAEMLKEATAQNKREVADIFKHVFDRHTGASNVHINWDEVEGLKL